jgi:glycosyltransferase involved in cell wall biosynthesis
MPKIAFITSGLQAGGAEQQWLELIKNVDKAKFSVVIICLYDLGTIGRKMRGMGFITYSNLLRNRYSLFSLFSLINILKKEKISLIFLIDQPLSIVYGILAAKISRIKKIILSVHSTGYLDRKIRNAVTMKLFLKYCDHIIALSGQHKEYLIKYNRFPKEKILVIPNGINIPLYSSENLDPNGLRQELGISNGQKIVGMVGRLHPLKRHDIFIKAASLVRKSCPNVKFLIIGEGEERKNIEKLITQLELTGDVKLLGYRNDIPVLNKILDVSVLCSDTEALPMSLIEAMASSVPVVATKVGSVSDLIINGENGYLVSPNSCDDLADSIVKILTNKELAKQMGQRGLQIAQEKYSIQDMVKEYEKVFSEAVH